MKKLTMVLGTALSSVALVGGIQTVAQAAPAPAPAAVPSCVSIKHVFVPFSPYDNYLVTNGCSSTVSVKVEFQNGATDTACNTISAGGTKELKYWAFANPGVKGLITC